MTALPRRLLAAVLGVLGLLALLYVADLALTHGRLPRGTRVAGVEIGGKTVAQATRLVARGVHPPAQVTVAAPEGVAPLTVTAAEVGLRVDAAKTVAKVQGTSLNPVARITALFRHRDVRPVVTVDRDRLRAVVADWARRSGRTPREGAVRFDGATPVEVLPHSGVTIDVDKTVATLLAAYPSASRVPATVTVTPVKTTAAAVGEALLGIAKPAVAEPLRLRAPKGTVTLTRLQIASFLRIEGPSLTARVDRKALDTVLDTVLPPVETLPKDAPVTVDEAGAVHIGESAIGQQVDRDVLAGSLVSALTAVPHVTVDLTLVDAQPRVSTALAKTLGIKEKVSEFTTHHPCCKPRVTNIHKIADIVNGAIVLPGETFSLNGYVGARDSGRGFVEAPMILNGHFVPAIGGGVSQFATTMFNAVFFGGFVDVYHKPHSYYISRYPAGREATVSTPSPDLKWRNDSPYGVLVTTSYTGTSVTVTFWSTKRYDIEAVAGARYRIKPFRTVHDPSPTCESSSGESGFDIDVWRVFKVAGKEVKREKFHTRYLPEPHFVCG